MKDRFPLNETDQAQLDALRERMEAEQYATLAATKNDEDSAYEAALRARARGGNERLSKQAQAVAADPDDLAEMRAIQQDMEPLRDEF